MASGKSLLLLVLFLNSSNVIAQSVDTDKEEGPVAIGEVGAAASRSIQEGSSSFGPTVAIEVEPIESWLEIEAGVMPLFSHGSAEWNTDLIFKKPWTLSPKTEFMIGLGPEWVHSKGINSISVEFAVDFMYWTSSKHRFGWYIEPTYEYSFRAGHERSIGVMGGLLIGIRRRNAGSN
jgi:hypothetical protein